MVITSASPATVAQQMSELLLCFPAAAIGGVQWKTLVRKYEERHSASLDLASLGHSTPLAATTALLWDVLRVVDSEDTDNPIVAVEDSVALTPKPGSAGSWPSLYQVLCEIVLEHGMGCDEILVSQLKPLLQRHWHSTFDEGSLGYLTEEGTAVKLKKMKHLLQALLRWRHQRLAWQAGRKGPVDKALEKELELVPSKRHNDLLLRFKEAMITVEEIPESRDSFAPPLRRTLWSDAAEEEEEERAADTLFLSSCQEAEVSSSPSSVLSSPSAAMEEEIAALRAENARLRAENEGTMQLQVVPKKPISQLPQVILQEGLLDDPFEPPPQVWSQSWGPCASPTASTMDSFSCYSSSTEGTPIAGSLVPSGATTPVPQLAPVGQVCTFVPVGWFAMDGRGEIPNGLVQQAKTVFERHTAIPNWFAQQ